MSYLLRIWEARKHLLMLGLLLIVAALSSFNAFISIGVGVVMGHLLLNGVTSGQEKKPFVRVFFWFNFLVWILVLLSFFWSEDKVYWWSVTSRKLPLIILPLVIWKSAELSLSQLKLLTRTLVIALLVTDLSTLLNYYLHFREINESILHSKSIPVYFLGYYTSTTHIYLGVHNTLALVACGWLYKHEQRRWLVLCLGLFFIAFLHVLSSRTGLLALYGVLGTGVAYKIIAWKQYKWGGILALVLVLLPLAAYYVMPSFENRIRDTFHDLTYKQRGQTNNHMSVSMRFEAWHTALQLFERNPAQGVGAGDIKPAMEQQYIENQSALFQENRILPHNQYLEAAATYGIGGFVFLVLSLFSMLGFREQLRSPYLLLVWAAFLFAFFFESLLERELGIVAYALYPLLAFHWGKAEKA